MKKGSIAVLVTLVLSSLVFLLLAALEIACGHAAAAQSEDLALICGRSVLSEYNRELFEQYGIFALSSDSARLTALTRFYASEGLQNAGSLVKMELLEASADCRGCEALDTEDFLAQTEKLGMLRFAEEILNGHALTESFSEALAAGSRDQHETSFMEQIRELSRSSGKSGEDDEEDDAAERRKQAQKLLKDYREATREDDIPAASGGRHIEKSSALPSVIRGFGARGSLLFSGGARSVSAGVLLTDRYLLSVCGHQLSFREDSPLRSEVEYILYGFPDDQHNENTARRGIFGLRFSLDLLAVMTDTEKLAEYTETAVTVFPMLPAPAVVFALAAIDAGTQAHREVGSILSGGTVPVIRSMDGFGSYEDYLSLLLLLLPEEEKAARLMDIMQMNVACRDGDFAFSRCAYGVNLRLRLSKKTHVLGAIAEPYRCRTVEQTHVYQ